MKFRLLSLTFLFLLCSFSAFAVDNKAYVQDGKIMIETSDGVNELDYSHRGKYSKRYSSKWRTREEVKPVLDSLKAYQDKSKTYFNKRVWFIDSGNGVEDFYVEFTTDDQNYHPLILPNEHYAYYLGYSETGVKSLFGADLWGGKTFFVDQASQFKTVTCSQDKSFIVVQQDHDEVKQFIVYDQTGKKTDTTIDSNTAYEEFQDTLCQ